MAESYAIERLHDALGDPHKFVTYARTASGLALRRCVDVRLAGVGYSLRQPGNAENDLTVMTMRGYTRTLRDGIPLLKDTGVLPGGHTEICAYDHNLPTIMKGIANGKPRVRKVYETVVERILPRFDLRTRNEFGSPNFEAVSNRARAVVEAGRLDDHVPDELVPAIREAYPGIASVVTPLESPEPAIAYVIDASVDGMVPREDVLPPAYFDSTPDSILASQMPIGWMADAIALSASTGDLVAEKHGLPLVVVSGSFEDRRYITV
jgi:hypothetical protein